MRDELSVLSAFLAVADERSFTRAAKRLNVSTSGLSHAIRRLEEQIGVRLLTRTTRSVSPTDAGEQLLAQLRPALSDIRGVLTSLSGLQSTPVGRIRLLCPRLAAKTVVGAEARTVRARLSGRRARDHDRRQPCRSRVGRLRCGHSVWGIHRAGHGGRSCLAGPPAGHRRGTGYFDSHPKPTSPREVLNHQCIRFRHRGEGVYKWEFDKGDESLAIAVHGSLLLDELDLMIQAALDGAGLAWVAEDRVTEHLASGALLRVLGGLVPAVSGVLSVLSESPAAARGAGGSGRYASTRESP